MPLSPARTFWRMGGFACTLYTGEGRFELRITEGDVVRRHETCSDSGDAFQKSRRWSSELRHPLDGPSPLRFKL